MREIEQVLDEPLETRGVALDDPEEPPSAGGVLLERDVERLCRREDGRDGRTQLVRHVRDEVATQRLEASDVGDVEEHREETARVLSERRAADEEPSRLEAAELDLPGAGRLRPAGAIEQLLELRMTDDLEQRLPDDVCAEQEHLAQRRVHQRDLALLVEEENALLHAVEDAAHEVALAAELTHGA